MVYWGVVGGLAIVAGAMVFGSRVLEMVVKGITELCVIGAVFVEFVAAIIVHSASVMGIPVSLGEIVTASIIGIGCANEGLLAAGVKRYRGLLRCGLGCCWWLG